MFTFTRTTDHIMLKRPPGSGWSRGPDASTLLDRRVKPNIDLVRVDHACAGNPRPLHPETLVLSLSSIPPTMHRSQSVRRYTRTSVSHVPTDDLGVLNEAPEESTEVALRRQLLAKSKENDKVWCSALRPLIISDNRTDLAPFLYTAARPNTDTPSAARAAPTD